MAQTNRRTTQQKNDFDFNTDPRRASVLTNAITNIGNRGTIIEKSGLQGPGPKPKWLFCEKNFTKKFSNRLVQCKEANKIFDEYETELLKKYLQNHSIVLRRCNADEADLRKYGREFERALEPILQCEVVHLHRAMRIDFRTNYKFNTGKTFETALDDLMFRPKEWLVKKKDVSRANSHVPDQFMFQVEDHLGDTISKMSINQNGPSMVYITCAWCSSFSLPYLHGPNHKVSIELTYTTDRGKQKKVGKLLKTGLSFLLPQKLLGSTYTFNRPKNFEIQVNYDELKDSTDITFSIRFFEVEKPTGLKTNVKYAFTDLIVSNRSFEEYFSKEREQLDQGKNKTGFFTRLINRNSVGFV